MAKSLPFYYKVKGVFSTLMGIEALPVQCGYNTNTQFVGQYINLKGRGNKFTAINNSST